jgi:hypothetical protein
MTHLIAGVDHDNGVREIYVTEDGYLVASTEWHDLIHQGKVWTLNFRDTGVANNGYSYLRGITGAKKLHFIITFGNGGEALVNTYTGTTYTVVGTAPDGIKLSVFNRNPAESKPLLSTFTYNPTIGVLGAVRGIRAIYGGSGGGAQGSTSSEPGIESVIPPNSEFLIRIQNLAGTAESPSIVMEMYEE